MLASRIRESRKRLGWSQADLARQMHVAQPTVSSWEAGRKAPRLKIMERLAHLLGVSFEWLSTGRGKLEQQIEFAGALENISGSFHSEKDNGERRLLVLYGRLKPLQQHALLGFLESLRP